MYDTEMNEPESQNRRKRPTRSELRTESTRLVARVWQAAGVATIIAGLFLLAHPVYVGSLTIYPGTDWAFLPMFNAAFTATGVVAFATGTFLVWGRSPSDRDLVIVAATTIIAAAFYAVVVLGTYGSSGPYVMEGYAGKRALVGSVTAGLFLLGVAATSRRRRIAGYGLVAPVVPLLFVVIDWRSGALLGPVVDVWILLTATPLRGVEGIGPLLFLASAALGLLLGIRNGRIDDQRRR